MTGAANSLSPTRAELLARLTRQGVYLVTDDGLPVDVMLARLEAALRAGIDVVQFRMKGGTTREALRVGEAVARLCVQHDAQLIGNDRADLAIAVGCQGLHVGQDDLPPEHARRVLGADRLLGVSVSYVEEAVAVQASAEIDYIGFGAMYPTMTKPDAEYAGLEMLRTVRGLVTKPIVAIGGITLDNAAEVVQAGADSVAVVSAILRSDDPGSAARSLLERVAMARNRG